MNRGLFIVFTFILFATSAYAQNVMPRSTSQHTIMVPCDTSQYVKDLVEREFKEKLLFDAEGLVFAIPPGSKIEEASPVKADVSLYVNMQSGRWSLVLKPNDDLWCLLINGAEFVAGGN